MVKNQAQLQDGDLNAKQLHVLELAGKLHQAITERCDLVDEAKAHREEAKIIDGRIPDASKRLEEVQAKYNAAVQEAIN